MASIEKSVAGRPTDWPPVSEPALPRLFSCIIDALLPLLGPEVAKSQLAEMSICARREWIENNTSFRRCRTLPVAADPDSRHAELLHLRRLCLSLDVVPETTREGEWPGAERRASLLKVAKSHETRASRQLTCEAHLRLASHHTTRAHISQKFNTYAARWRNVAR